jgi:hypothetical protein
LRGRRKVDEKDKLRLLRFEKEYNAAEVILKDTRGKTSKSDSKDLYEFLVKIV